MSGYLATQFGRANSFKIQTTHQNLGSHNLSSELQSVMAEKFDNIGPWSRGGVGDDGL